MNKLTDIKKHIHQLRPTVAGLFFYHVLPYRKKVILSNMEQVFANHLNQNEIQKLAKAFYSHLAKSLKEMFLMRFMSLKKVASKAELEGLENIEDIVLQKQNMLLLTGHFGNWEFAPIAGILNFEEYKNHFYFIRKTLKIEWIEKILFRRFHQAGLKIISKKNALAEVSDAMEKKAAIVFVMDQHACIKAKDGINVPFFNKDAGTYRSLAMLAKYTKAPVVPVQTYRKDNGKHVLKFHPPLPLLQGENSRDELYKNTLQYNQALESMILEKPEQWLWMHKRWKL